MIVVGVFRLNEVHQDGYLPQGNVLGLQLFIIIVNDIPESVWYMVRLISDDTKILASINARDLFQEDFDTLKLQSM